MPDTQSCADRCGQMHGAGAAAGASPHTCCDVKRLPALAIPPLHSQTSASSGALPSSKVRSRRFTEYDSGAPLHNNSPHLPSSSTTNKAGPRRRYSSQKQWNPQGCKEADKAALRCTRTQLRVSHTLSADSAPTCVLWE